ncbi:hypothetical protein HAX54_048888, partial [Datura stramonium]|nr:hypothetical protein [Datura stramonium]
RRRRTSLPIFDLSDESRYEEAPITTKLSGGQVKKTEKRREIDRGEYLNIESATQINNSFRNQKSSDCHSPTLIGGIILTPFSRGGEGGGISRVFREPFI